MRERIRRELARRCWEETRERLAKGRDVRVGKKRSLFFNSKKVKLKEMCEGKEGKRMVRKNRTEGYRKAEKEEM